MSAIDAEDTLDKLGKAIQSIKTISALLRENSDSAVV